MLGNRLVRRRRERRPQNESQEHWRLKRLCRYIAWATGCWASAPEFILTVGFAENGERSVVDMLAVGKVLTRKEKLNPTDPGYLDREWASNERNQHYLGIIAFECKATINDLRAGMVTAGAHKHYCVVPESLREDALRLVPKHVGIITAAPIGRKVSRWDTKIARGARRREDAMLLPLWCYTKTNDPPPEWTRLLLSMAVCNTNYAVRWQT